MLLLQTDFELKVLYATSYGRAAGAAAAKAHIESVVLPQHPDRKVRLMYELATLQRDLGDETAAEATYFRLLDEVRQ